jgi:predicted N-acetyltransferase YhbS
MESSMAIRKIEERDLEAVSAICMASFSKSVAGTLTEDGVSTFSKIAASDAFLHRMKEDNLILVAELDGNIAGVIELKEGRHIAMFFVEPEHQNKGIGRKLISSALSYAKASKITVNASLSSIPAYRKYGFECKGDIGELSGLVYQPMEIEINRSMQPTAEAAAE